MIGQPPRSTLFPSTPLFRPPAWLIPSLIVALAAAGIGFVFLKRGHALTEKDSILITDFVNTTADPVFDGTLKKGSAVVVDPESTRLDSSHANISYAVLCLET